MGDAKQPHGGATALLEDWGWYTHRVTIWNERVVGIDDGQVAFRVEVYKGQAQLVEHSCRFQGREGTVLLFTTHLVMDKTIVYMSGSLAARNLGAPLGSELYMSLIHI